MKVIKFIFVLLLFSLIQATTNCYAEEAIKSAAVNNIGKEVPDLGILSQKTAYGFSICLLFLSIGLLVYKKTVLRDSSSQHNLINILSRKNISPKTALLLIEVEGNKYLLSQNLEKIELLSELSTSLVIRDNEVENLEKNFLEKKCA